MISMGCCLGLLWPYDTIWHCRCWSILVQVMPHQPELELNILHIQNFSLTLCLLSILCYVITWTNGDLLSRLIETNFNEIIEIQTFSMKKMYFEYVICKMAAILLRPHCVKKYHYIVLQQRNSISFAKAHRYLMWLRLHWNDSANLILKQNDLSTFTWGIDWHGFVITSCVLLRDVIIHQWPNYHANL